MKSKDKLVKSSNPLRIALISDDMYPASGGITRSIQTQINELVRRGHEVTLIAPQYNLEQPANCETIVMPSIYISGMPAQSCFIRQSQRTARRICRRHQFDIIHSQTERGGLALAARIAKLQNIPHVHTFHGNLAGSHDSQPFTAAWGSLAYIFLISPVISLIAKKQHNQPVHLAPKSPDATRLLARFDWRSMANVASRVDIFTAPADFMIQRITECAGNLSIPSRTIPTGINPELSRAISQAKRHRSDNTIRFLSICRLAPEKRIDTIIRAFIKADIPNSELHIAGSGHQLRRLRQLAKGHDNIIFRGHMSGIDQVAEALVNADVFVLASYGFDTQAMTIGEAAIAGLPIIYCDPRLTVGVNKDNSILTDGPEVEHFAAAMQQLAADPKKRQKMSQASIKLAPELTPDRMAEKYLALYREIIKRKTSK